LLAGVPVIASNVGGIPEVVMDDVTGKLVPVRSPGVVAHAVIEVLANLEHYRGLGETGRRLVGRMFDVERTGREVYQIYRHILQSSARPREFNSRDYVRQLAPLPETISLNEVTAESTVV